MIGHRDESGAECTRHVASLDALLAFAAIGARVASFNHDIASKLQGLMMSLDEIAEICERVSDSDLHRATETAQQSIKEATALLSANRMLTRTSTKSKVQLRDLVEAASARTHVDVRGGIPDALVDVVAALTTQGFALALDALAGVGRNRAVDVTATVADGRAQLLFASDAEPAKTVGDAFALAAFVFARAGGELRCRDGGFVVQLPVT